MPAVYTPEWYDAVRDAINTRVAQLPEVPDSSFNIAIEIVGEGRSPYVGHGRVRRFLVRLEDGACAWYREVDADDPSVELDYRFTGPASAFDEVSAGILDPIDAALRGTIHVRGDMRFLMRQAHLVQTLLEAYARDVQTEWPLGAPPYGDGRE